MINFNQDINPDKLVVFTEKYNETLPDLRKFLLKNAGSGVTTQVHLKRLNLKDTTFTNMTARGVVTKVEDNLFIMKNGYTKTSPNSITEFGEKVIRFDSFLGEIPVLTEEVVPCQVNHEFNSEYTLFLQEVKNHLRKYEGKSKTFNMNFKNFFVPNLINYYLNASVLKVNESNVELAIKYSVGTIKPNSIEPEGGCYYNTIPRVGVRPFITPITLLTGVSK